MEEQTKLYLKKFKELLQEGKIIKEKWGSYPSDLKVVKENEYRSFLTKARILVEKTIGGEGYLYNSIKGIETLYNWGSPAFGIAYNDLYEAYKIYQDFEDITSSEEKVENKKNDLALELTFDNLSGQININGK